MFKHSLSARLCALAVAVLLLGACAPTAAPGPAAPAKPAAQPAATAAPAAPPAAPATATASAQPGFDEAAVAAFYRGKTVRVLVGHAPGGGYDTYARMIARHLGKHIPGNPNLIVENMPGAGSMIALNHAYSVGPKDGTLIVGPDGGLALQQLFGNPAVEFDLTKVHFLGAPSGFDYIMAVTRRAGITRFEDILGPSGKQIVLGGVPNTKIDHSSLLIRDVLGANVRLVSGYTGTAPLRLAMEAGEVDGVITSWESLKITNRKEFESGEWLIPVQLTERPIEDLPQRNVPLIYQFTKDEEQRQLFQFGVIGPNLFSRPYIVAPGVPADRVQALETAFAKTMADPEFLADAEKLNADITPLTGDQIRQLIVDFLGMPVTVRDKLKPILLPGG